MIFHETELKGAFIIEPERNEDDRGFFARTWCQQEFAARGLNERVVQCSISFNRRRGTIRGMHFQEVPHAEARLVRCTHGAIYDVIVDLRRESSTFARWIAVNLTAEEHNMIYVPEGFAHGFQTLRDDTEVFYQISEFYHRESARGVRWDDPKFQIQWPLMPTVISDRDQSYRNYL